MIGVTSFRSLCILGVVLFSVLISAKFGVSSARVQPLCPMCNVILIDIDVLRAEELSCLGYHRNTTPNICAAADRGVLFSKAIAQSILTGPSILSTITSTYPRVHRFGTSQERSGLPTIAQTLRRYGYHTEFHKVLHEFAPDDQIGTIGGYDVTQKHASESEWTEEISRLLQGRSPFFAHFFTSSLHMPYLLSEEIHKIESITSPPGFPQTREQFSKLVGKFLVAHYREVFSQEAILERPDIFLSDSGINPETLYSYYETLRKSSDFTRLQGQWYAVFDAYMEYIVRGGEDAVSYMRLAYDSLLQHIDRQIGMLLDTVKRPSGHSKTIVIITSSHGEEFGDHGGFAHQKGNYNELLHVPLIFVVPTLQSKTINEAVENIDIYPTISDIVGARKSRHLQGKTLLPYLLGTQVSDLQYAIAEFIDLDGASIQSREWKLIVNDMADPARESELYYLRDDPKERNNIADQRPEVVNWLFSRLRRELMIR